MNKKALSLVAGAVFLALIPCVAASQETPKFGPYIGVGLDLAEESFERFHNGKGFDTGVGILLTGGYRFHPNIAVEAKCEYLLRLNSRDRDVNILTFSGNVKGYLSAQRFQPFALLGLGITRIQIKPQGQGEASHVGMSAHFGGGFDYYLTPRVSVGITAIYVATTRNIGNLNHTTIGFGTQYRF